MKIRLLHIIWSSNTGGIERLVLQLWKNQLLDETISPEVYAGQPGGTLWEEFKRTGKVHEGSFRGGMDFNTGKIRSLIDLFSQYDILHFHSFHPATAYAAAKSGKKIIYTEHGNFGFGRGTTMSDLLIRYLLRRFLQNHSRFITFNSAFSKNIANRRYQLDGIKQEVVYNGIELNPVEFDAPPDADIAGFCKGNKIIGCVGRLAAVKRIERLIAVFSLLAENSDMRLLIIGDGPLEQELKLQVSGLGLDSKVMFTGRRQDVRRYYQHMHIFVLPSANEAFGLVVVEALFAGTPVLVFNDAGGPVEIVSKAEPENICRNEQEMAERILHLLSNSSVADKKEIRKSVASAFNITKMKSAFSRIYQEL
ncbi:MAG: glycosyltransferase family 4 protein [Bacteroidia bacterium]